MEHQGPASEQVVAAQLLHDQAEYLLNDQVGYASALKESRRTATTLVALLVGIGVFRVDLFRSAGLEPAVADWALLAIRGLFLLAILCFGAGAYFLYTERGLVQELIDAQGADSPRSDLPGSSQWGRGGGALSVLHLSEPLLRQFFEKDAASVLRMKTEALRVAYVRLVAANRRVRKRLSIGTGWVFGGLALVLCGFSLYTVTVKPILDGAAGAAP